jgi:dolichol-phosphate mannosyltransferase
VIFVNDGSTDKSWEELLRLKELYKGKVSLLNLSRNFGQLGALFAGFNSARGDAVICVSADLQDPISLMGKMVAYWRTSTELVICYRENRKDGIFTGILSSFAHSIARISYPELPRGGFDYWLMSRRVCNLLCSLHGRNMFLQGYLSSVGFSKAFIPYTRMSRKSGRSGYTFGSKVDIVMSFLVNSSAPIRVMSCLGVFISLCGLIYSLLIVHAWLMHATPFSGWAPLMIVSMVIGGTLMMMLGLIGEYIWRIYENVRNFPLFVIEKKSMSGRDESSK